MTKTWLTNVCFSLENISGNFKIHFQNDEEINNNLFFKAWTEVKYMIARENHSKKQEPAAVRQVLKYCLVST